MLQKPKDETFWHRKGSQNTSKGFQCRMWPDIQGQHSEASPDQSNTGRERTRGDRNNSGMRLRAQLGPVPVGPAAPFTKGDSVFSGEQIYH